MGMSAGSARGSVKNDINVTPLIDVVLVLLIIFMVVTPMLQRGKDVTLPRSKSIDEKSKKEKQNDPIILSVTPSKEMYLEQDKMDEENLQRNLALKLEPDPNRQVLLKGDQSLTFADVRKVMKITKAAGAKSVGLGVEEIKEGE